MDEQPQSAPYKMLDPLPKGNRSNLKAVVCDQTGQEWESISECARHFNVNMVSIIYRIKNEINRSARGGNALKHYTFSYKNKPTPEKVKVKISERWMPVRCIQTGKEYRSARKACIDLGLSTGQLTGYFQGKYKNVKGYTFERL